MTTTRTFVIKFEVLTKCPEVFDLEQKEEEKLILYNFLNWGLRTLIRNRKRNTSKLQACEELCSAG